MSMRTLFRPIDESFICQYLHNWSVKHAPLCLSSDSGMRFTFRLCLSFSCSLSVFRLNNVPEQFCGCIIITFKTWMMIWSVIAVKGSFIEWMSITRNRKMWLSCGHRIFNIFNRVIFRRNHFTVLDRLIGLNKQERKRQMHTKHLRHNHRLNKLAGCFAVCVLVWNVWSIDSTTNENSTHNKSNRWQTKIKCRECFTQQIVHYKQPHIVI